MRELLNEISDVEVLLDLEPEELGAKLLFLVRQRRDEMFHVTSLETELWTRDVSEAMQFPRKHQPQIEIALIEAWAWLEAQGLIIPAPGNPQFRILSRRARKFESEAEFANFSVARRLPREILHPRIQQTVWMAFMRGEFDVAVFQAMKAVEIAVRDAAGLGAKATGVDLMRTAFSTPNGPLTDDTVVAGEREALQHLFAGAIGSYKNPHSHRDVPLDDPNEAMEIILLANHLLRIVDSRVNKATSSVRP